MFKCVKSTVENKITELGSCSLNLMNFEEISYPGVGGLGAWREAKCLSPPGTDGRRWGVVGSGGGRSPPPRKTSQIHEWVLLTWVVINLNLGFKNKNKRRETTKITRIPILYEFPRENMILSCWKKHVKQHKITSTPIHPYYTPRTFLPSTVLKGWMAMTLPLNSYRAGPGRIETGKNTKST